MSQNGYGFVLLLNWMRAVRSGVRDCRPWKLAKSTGSTVLSGLWVAMRWNCLRSGLLTWRRTFGSWCSISLCPLSNPCLLRSSIHGWTSLRRLTRTGSDRTTALHIGLLCQDSTDQAEPEVQDSFPCRGCFFLCLPLDHLCQDRQNGAGEIGEGDGAKACLG